MKHKHYELAYRAHLNISFSPEERAEGACSGFDEDIASLRTFSVPEEKIAKYESLWIKWMNAKSRCLSCMITGTANFPVARNEKANNAERKAGDTCLEYYNKLISYAKKAENPNTRPIMAGDSDALERLQKNLDGQKKAHETMLAVNAELRKTPIDIIALAQLLGSEERAREMLEPDFAGRLGFSNYSLSNSRAEITRLESRISEIEKRKATTPQEIIINGARVIENTGDMRLELYFDGKPSDAVRSCLKSNAFKWAPSKGAWQRQLTNNAIYAFKNNIKPILG